jgi:hypothetical protein
MKDRKKDVKHSEDLVLGTRGAEMPDPDRKRKDMTSEVAAAFGTKSKLQPRSNEKQNHKTK